MKHLIFKFLLFIVPILSISCSKDDNKNGIIGTGYNEYKGLLEITKDGTLSYMEPNADVIATYNAANNSVTLLLKDIKFDDKMPMTLDITLSNIPCTIDEFDDISFNVASIVPTVAGKPYEQFTFTNLKGRVMDIGMDYTANCIGNVIKYYGMAVE